MSGTITVPAATRSVITATPKTTFKVGSYNSVTDTFTSTLDLNDHVNYWLVSADLAQPQKIYARTSTIRAPGERISNWNYQNRHITLTLQLLYEANSAGLLAAVRALLAAIENPPYRLAFAAPNSTVLTYADVVAVTTTIPYDGKQILAGLTTKISIVFECAPGFSGDRITLQNLVVNPGFEAPSGPSVQGFNDPFANANAYTVMAGSAPTVSANVMTIPAGGQVAFGSPEWSTMNTWQVRWQATTGTQAAFYLHFTDANNNLFWQCYFGGLGLTSALAQLVGGTLYTLASNTITISGGTWYWMVATQFPTAPGTPALVMVTIYNDNAGSIGSVLGTFGPVATHDGVTALSGRPRLSASGSSALPIGGAFPNVHVVSLFGPGAWVFGNTGGAGQGVSSGAWEQNTANTYPGGATTSYGAARIDLPPAGTVGASWESYSGGAPLGTSAIPCATGNVMAASAVVKSSGLSGTAALALQLREWDASGALLRATSLQSVSGNQAAWTQLSGSATIGATTAYCSVMLQVSDATAGASANATVWWDNAQCWNQTTTGQTVMPYCELRFPQAPAQLLLTGVQGDMVAPAAVAWGTYLTSWGIGATLSYALGRRAQASANARLSAASVGFYGAALSPTATAVLDASSYGGYYLSAALNPGWNPRAFSFAPSDALGVYHVFSRVYSSQSAGNLPNVQTRMVTQQKTGAWYGSLTNADQIGAYYGTFSAPLSASTTWTPCDAGQANVPALPVGALTDLTQNYLTPRAQWQDLTGGGSTLHVNWQLLLPVDGSVLLGSILNPANAPFAVTTSWLWGYLDGLLANQFSQLNGETLGEGATYSLESTPTPTAAHAGGGAGTSGTGVISINNNADPYLTLDPNLSAAAVNGASGVAAGGSGVNQFAGYIADNAGAVLPLYAEFAYTPLYLYPRQQ